MAPAPQINLLDTPGHQDFSEDTYRTLAAADNAVMLVDGGRPGSFRPPPPQRRNPVSCAARRMHAGPASIFRPCPPPLAFSGLLLAGPPL
jgi:hypothetical protein